MILSKIKWLDKPTLSEVSLDITLRKNLLIPVAQLNVYCFTFLFICQKVQRDEENVNDY